MWERSFVGVSVLLGASLDDALTALDGRGAAAVSELTATLRDPRRTVRAKGLAAVGQEVALAIAESTLR